MNYRDKWLPVEIVRGESPEATLGDIARKHQDKIVRTSELPKLNWDESGECVDDEFHNYDDSEYVPIYNENRVRNHTYQPYPGGEVSLWARKVNQSMKEDANYNFRNRR